MRFILLFFILSLSVVKKASAVDYFSGNLSKEETSAVKPVKEKNETETKAEINDEKPEVSQKDEITPTPLISETQSLPVTTNNEPLVKKEKSSVDFFMNEVKGSRPYDNSEYKEEKKEEVININYTYPAITTGGITYCQFGFVFENFSGAELKRLRVSFSWNDNNVPSNRGFKKNLLITGVKNGASDKKFYKIPGSHVCDTISSNSPKAKIESCLIEGISEVECAKKIKFNK